ncbi:hypothetical protein DEU56DRAFT_915826 [Suillus clintonianus]|uniref:uncharacterized protein n=1 Tax=Suillus clintonianus TaxID=1904413 RepID=UPI001B864AF3|nr:uncharacterized protein DEU56DRAFT_915826 [Suillus clintonianus]KAG2127113.1 hypothetical protein DEU56DRAFT_915826 [Suillus clintonianus]
MEQAEGCAATGLEIRNHHSVPSVQCPNCRLGFASNLAVVDHLNDQAHSCWSREPTYRLPVPPAFQRGDNNREEVTGQYHSKSGYLFGRGRNVLQEMEDHDSDQGRRRAINSSYPFVDQAEWQLAEFLIQRLTQTDINKFLKLDWFKSRPSPSFKSADQLFGWIDALPSGPAWQSTTLKFTNYTTIRPIELIWRDGLEVVKDIFANPIFSNHMMYDPHIVMVGSEREYGEFFTANRAFAIQVWLFVSSKAESLSALQNNLPEGATIIPIILASDKTPVTRMSGGLEMHPVFLTIGNIQSEVRMKATAHAWSCVAFIPIPKFDVHGDFQTLLHARLFHKCMDLIFAKCKVATRIGEYMPDPMGYLRHCFTPLVAYTADLPEAQLIACVSKSASPLTMATQSDFGSAQLFPRRTGDHTLKLIYDLCQRVDPWNVPLFQREAKALLLSGVHQPYWRDWPYADPSSFLPGELLHTCHKYFGDHPLKWCKEVVGEDELDARYKAHHKRVGTHHFGSGISHISQMTCREHRDIERTIVATIAGAANTTPNFVHAICFLTEFIYQAQSPIHTDSSIDDMVHSLGEFHRLKQAILDTGARRGKSGTINNFSIPKIELFHSFAGSIKDIGSLLQFSADVSERLLITHCKFPFERTSRQARNFTLQVVQILNRDETMCRFNLYTLLHSHGTPLVNAIATEDSIVAETDPTLAWIARVLPSEQKHFHGLHPIQNHFLKGILSVEANAAFHVTVSPDHKSLSITDLQSLYSLPDFGAVLTEYINDSSQNTPTTAWTCTRDSVRTWNKFRLQLLSTFKSRVVMPSQIVQVFPPSDTFPLGNCDAVLVQLPANDDTYIAQVHCIFQAVTKKGHTLPRYLEDSPLLYVQYFQITATPTEDMSAGIIIPLTVVTCAIKLIPVYGSKMDRTISAANAMEICDEYYLNTFSDKEVFNTMHSGLM